MTMIYLQWWEGEPLTRLAHPHFALKAKGNLQDLRRDGHIIC
jgi:hypothetical protein